MTTDKHPNVAVLDECVANEDICTYVQPEGIATYTSLRAGLHMLYKHGAAARVILMSQYLHHMLQATMTLEFGHTEPVTEACRGYLFQTFSGGKIVTVPWDNVLCRPETDMLGLHPSSVYFFAFEHVIEDLIAWGDSYNAPIESVRGTPFHQVARLDILRG